MLDICVDYCESVNNCDECEYKDATDEEREEAYYEIVDKLLRKES